MTSRTRKPAGKTPKLGLTKVAKTPKVPSNATKARRQVTSERRITRLTTRTNSIKAVFNTTELLENILVHLPARSIYQVRRISQQFRDCISASPSLQDKLFLTLKEPLKIWSVPARTIFSRNSQKEMKDISRDSQVVLSASKKSSGGHFLRNAIATKYPTTAPAYHLRPVKLNPLLLEHSYLKSQWYQQTRRQSLADGWPEQVFTARLNPRCKLPFAMSGLLSKTSLTDPPVQNARVLCAWRRRSYSISASRDIECPSGITLGHVFKELFEGHGVCEQWAVNSDQGFEVDGGLIKVLAKAQRCEEAEVSFENIEISVEIPGVIIPSDEERLRVERGE